MGGRLERLDPWPALHFVVVERRFYVIVPLEGVGQGDGVFHRQLRPRPDGEMGRVGRVSQQDNIFVSPGLVADPDEVDPAGLVGHQGVATQLIREELLTVGDARGLVCLVQAGPPPARFVALDDEGAGVAVERVHVGLEQSVLVFLKDEGEGVEWPGGAQPDVLCLAGLQARLEDVGISFADHAVDPISTDEQVEIFDRG